jgi:hypothetical protein
MKESKNEQRIDTDEHKCKAKRSCAGTATAWRLCLSVFIHGSLLAFGISLPGDFEGFDG